MLFGDRKKTMHQATDLSRFIADATFEISCDLSKLPEGAVLEPELRWTNTSRTIEEHMRQFSPSIREKYSNRKLQLVQAETIGAGIHAREGFGIDVMPSDNYVVISFPK